MKTIRTKMKNLHTLEADVLPVTNYPFKRSNENPHITQRKRRGSEVEAKIKCCRYALSQDFVFHISEPCLSHRPTLQQEIRRERPKKRRIPSIFQYFYSKNKIKSCLLIIIQISLKTLHLLHQVLQLFGNALSFQVQQWPCVKVEFVCLLLETQAVVPLYRRTSRQC